jgi:hypothetical protein
MKPEESQMPSIDSSDRLDRAIAALKTDTAQAPPPAVDAAVAAAIARRNARRRVTARWHAWTWVVAPAAVAASAAALFIAQRASLDWVPDDPSAIASAEARSPIAATQFMPVVSMAELEQSGNALIVPARLPRMTLAELGLPVNPARAADAIDAELLVRRDGTLLAVRFTY